MSVSAIFGTRLITAPKFTTTTTPSSSPNNLHHNFAQTLTLSPPLEQQNQNHGLTIECSSRPQKKGTKHHMKTRPKKTAPWDKNRKPTVYDPLPALPPDWTPVSAEAGVADVTTATTSVE